MVQIFTSQFRSELFASVEMCFTPAKHLKRKQPCDIEICFDNNQQCQVYLSVATTFLVPFKFSFEKELHGDNRCELPEQNNVSNTFHILNA